MADMNDILIAMNQGFNSLHQKIDDHIANIHADNTEHRHLCEQRFQEIEQAIALMEADNKHWRTAGKVFLSTLITTLTAAIMFGIWKMVTEHAGIFK